MHAICACAIISPRGIVHTTFTEKKAWMWRFLLRKLSLKLKKNSTDKKRIRLSIDEENIPPERFQSVDQDTLDDLSKPFAPKNTKLNTQWAMNNLKAWFTWHNTQEKDTESCPEIILEPSCPAEILNRWLPVYVAETRNKSGDRYPPKTIYSLLAGILRHMSTTNPRYPNFLERSDKQFVDFQRSLDNIFRSLREKGVGATSKPTATITIEEENLLWEKGILNTTTPKGLFNAVFYYNGKNFILRGGQEHRELQNCKYHKL